MKWTVSLATVTLPTLVQTASIKTFATTEIVMKEEHVLIMALIPTPVSAMLAILVLIVRWILSAC